MRDGVTVDLDYQQIHDSLAAIVPYGTVFELRLLGTRAKQIDSGYFDDPAQAAHALVSAPNYYKGIYFTPNPVIPDAMARAYNRIHPWAQTTTHDTEIARRKWLPIDIDPKRPTGISSTEAEHEEALKSAKAIASTLTMLYGFPDPMIMDSGNGAWLLYRMDEENTDEVRDEISKFLRILSKQYAESAVDIDKTVYNAARISRVPGTWARKGDSTPDRPHRRSSILRKHDPFKLLSMSQVMRYNADYDSVLQGDKLTPQGKKHANEYPADETMYRRLNEYAMRTVAMWVPHFFPSARPYKEGFRIASADIGQQYEEELTIHPWPLGIKYFGVADQGDGTEGRRTPVGVIAEFGLQTIDKRLAAQQLSELLNFPITEFSDITNAQSASQPAAPGTTIGDFNGSNTPKVKYNFKGIRSIADLRAREFKPVKWVIDGVIPTGNMMLVARPKMRKTWLALQLALAISRGQQFLGWDTIKGDVLFLGLEDNERRIRNRINTLQKFEMDVGDLSGFRYWTGGMDYDASGRMYLANPEEEANLLSTFPRGDAGVDALEQYLEEFPNTSTIIIDTLAHFRGGRTSRDVYQADYDSMIPITKLAARKEVLIIPVHHEKKGNADRERGGDFLEDINGSAGISGGVDGAISIKGRRGVQEENESRKLLVSGRDVRYDYEIDISFDAETGGWRKALKEDVKVAIRDWLSRIPFMNKQDLATMIPHAGQARLYKALTEMKMEGEIEQTQWGYKLKRD